MRRALAILLAVLVVLVVLALGADLRRGPVGARPLLVAHAHDVGALWAGAAKQPIEVPYPVVKAGYGPRDRAVAIRAATPIEARALALRAGSARLTLVSLDLLEVDNDLLQDALAQKPADAGQLWLCATHSHTSFGAYDRNPLAEMVGTGSYDPKVRAALLDAIWQAVGAAWKAAAPARLAIGQGSLGGLTVNRDDAPNGLDDRFTRAELRADGRPIAELVIAAAHPTLAARGAPELDGDFPARLASLREQDGRISLFLQGAEGDASVDRTRADSPEAFAGALAARLPPLGPGTDALALAGAEAAVPLPPAAAGPVVPRWLRRGASNLLDRVAPHAGLVAAAKIGSLDLIAVPGEPTASAKQALLAALPGRSADDAVVVLGLCNGYLGYVDAAERVAHDEGEAKRTYFGASLLGDLAGGVRTAWDGLAR